MSEVARMQGAEDWPHILVVDDDDRIRQLLTRFLAEQNMFVTAAADAMQASELMECFHYDCIILDVMMPGISGLTWSGQLRAKGDRTPILMLSARGETEDRIAGLEKGVDDYLPKPFEPKELLLRIHAILERARYSQMRDAQTGVVIAIGEFRYHMDVQKLLHRDEAVYLTENERALLQALCESCNQPVERDSLARLLGVAEDSRAVDVTMNRLRKKIEPDQSPPQYIQTVRGVGYVLRAERVTA